MPVRATTPDVLTRARAALDADARTAAGNTALSRTEQEALPAGVLRDAAEAVRARDGRVAVESLALEAGLQIDALLGSVNTRGPSAVSQAEVRALHGVNPDAGLRVARAYELITGKHIELPGSTPIPVVPPSGGGVPARGTPVPISAFTQTPAPQMPYAGPTTLNADGTLSLHRGAAIPSTFTVDVRGQTFTATVGMSTGAISNVATPADVVEAIRKAVAPAYDVRVNQHATTGTTIELFALEAPPPANGPVYVFALVNGVEHRGALRFVLNQNDVYQPGQSISVRIDNKLYTATATRADTSAKTLVRKLRDLAVADGRTIDLREYTNYAPWTFIVTG